MLTEEARAALLKIARAAIEEKLRCGGTGPPPAEFPQLRERAGAFVTLLKDDQLRGCIGYVEPIKPLAEAVASCAVSAATGDPRFPPLRPDELPHVRIEISVLSPLWKIGDPAEIVVGQHGLMIVQGARQGLLLPQVAVEYGWDRDSFLRHVCLKAGLPPDAWGRGAELFIFTAEVFREPSEAEPFR